MINLYVCVMCCSIKPVLGIGSKSLPEIFVDMVNLLFCSLEICQEYLHRIYFLLLIYFKGHVIVSDVRFISEKFEVELYVCKNILFVFLRNIKFLDYIAFIER
ncbi:unnamed protein product [Larinioides sclopetarius]|uniref:Uncharacterized protein n=1 Tax=Larinioides sclopetarius TaxID=280406 RepID=A0AAV2BNU1_9ARAC